MGGHVNWPTPRPLRLARPVGAIVDRMAFPAHTTETGTGSFRLRGGGGQVRGRVVSAVDVDGPVPASGLRQGGRLA